ncbi:MAG: type II secretion system F family protein [Candidatus Micrarchaeota archaeon]|nr:type II secretion system F family protein [Candidatus Micrarchaeota archaeon]
MREKSFFEKLAARYGELARYHASTGIPSTYPVFLALVFILASGTSLFLSLVVRLGAPLSMAAFFAIMTLLLGVPVSLRTARIEAVEQNLPDVLKHLAIILRSGGTTEAAMAEVAGAGYGPLSDDIKAGLRGLRSGRTFDDVMVDAAEKSRSRLFRRCVTIIIDAKKAGAGMADVMYAISEDAREATRIKRERVSRTVMHVLFLVTASILISPFIFGFTISVVSFIGAGMAGALAETGGEAGVFASGGQTSVQALDSLLIGFIACQVTLTAFAIGVIREGKMLKYILYVPFMVLFALLVYEGGKFFSHLIVGAG